MESPQIAPAPEAAPALRLLEGRERAASGQAGMRAWITSFGALAFSGGHGVFLFSALTRMNKIPSQAELGSPLELVALGWFVAAVPLALVMLPLRGWYARLSGKTAWSLSLTILGASLAAFAFYLRAIALA